jgi:hypothetical protein
MFAATHPGIGGKDRLFGDRRGFELENEVGRLVESEVEGQGNFDWHGKSRTRQTCAQFRALLS